MEKERGTRILNQTITKGPDLEQNAERRMPFSIVLSRSFFVQSKIKGEQGKAGKKKKSAKLNYCKRVRTELVSQLVPQFIIFLRCY